MTHRVVSRRELLGAAAVSAAIGGLPACDGSQAESAGAGPKGFVPGRTLPWTNWAGTQSCVPASRIALETESQVVELLSSSSATLPVPIRAVGSSHSFSGLVPTDGTLIATDLLNGIVSSNAATLQAEVWAGTRLHALGPLLADIGQALPNQPDIDYPALGGATATSTHGTGTRFGSLSSYIVGLTLVTPTGELIECDQQRGPEIFQAARVSLGALGVVTRIKLQNERPFRLTENTRVEPLEDVLADLPQRLAAHRYFELYALPHTPLALTVSTNESQPTDATAGDDDPQTVYQLRQAYRLAGWLPAIGDSAYERLLKTLASKSGSTVRVGHSFEVLAHHRIVRFREMEYTVPAENGPACLREILKTIRAKRIPVVFPLEYRYVKADEIWLSPFQGRDGCSISVHQYGDTDYQPYFAAIEPIFWQHQGRPHWGKIHTLDARQLRTLYPHWQDFQEVRSSLDPAGRMLNSHLRTILGM